MHHALLTALLLASTSAPADAGRAAPEVVAIQPVVYDLEASPSTDEADPRSTQLDEALALMEVARFLRSLPGESPINPEQIEAMDDRASDLLTGVLASEIADWHLRVEGARCEGTEQAPELTEAALAVEQAERVLERGEVRYAPELIALLDFMQPPVEALSRLCTRG